MPFLQLAVLCVEDDPRRWKVPMLCSYVMGSRVTMASQGLAIQRVECHPSQHSDDSRGLNRHGSRPEIGFSDAESLRWKFKLDRRLSLRGTARWNLRSGTFFHSRGQPPNIFSGWPKGDAEVASQIRDCGFSLKVSLNAQNGFSLLH